MLQGEDDTDVLQIHTDHLGTPRAVTNAQQETVWKWEGDAFGSQSPQVETVKMPYVWLVSILMMKAVCFITIKSNFMNIMNHYFE